MGKRINDNKTKQNKLDDDDDFNNVERDKGEKNYPG